MGTPDLPIRASNQTKEKINGLLTSDKKTAIK
jgi:hypothetical protein